MATRILQGHVLDVLAQMPAASVQAAICSPPYLWLRSYGTEPQVWANPDGTPLCADGAHAWGETIPPYKPGQVEQTKWKDAVAAGAGQTATRGNICQSCGAWRGELGNEPSVTLYLAHLVSVFRTLRRVLRPDGVLAVNLGGSYYNNPGGQNGGAGNTLDYNAGRISRKVMDANAIAGRQERISHANDDLGLKPLDWVDVPGMFAQAMQRDGWTWRSDMALVKKAPLPESVSGTRFERCRVKVSKGVAANVTKQGSHPARIVAGFNERYFDGNGVAEWADCPGCTKCRDADGYVLRRGSGRPTRAWERLLVFAAGTGYFWDSDSVRTETAAVDPKPKAMRAGPLVGNHGTAGHDGNGMRYGAVYNNPAGRNLLDWQFWPHAPTKEQHYAAYPVALPTLIIKAATSERGACSVCGAPWARVVEREALRCMPERAQERIHASGGAISGGTESRSLGATADVTRTTLSWRPTCRCATDAPPVPCVVLDPFMGTGSTLIAADRLGRDAVGIDLKPEYVSLAVRRVTNDAPLFAHVEVA